MSLLSSIAPASNTRKVRSLANDNSGAIMVIGIFMACAMIGLTWEFIGLGDAMIWRDRSQEAADAASFSSAAVQARAMNILVFLNMVLLLMTVVYLAAAFIYNLSDFIRVLTAKNESHWYTLGVPECEVHAGELDLISAPLAETGITEVVVEITSYFCDIADINEPFHNGLKSFIEKYRDKVMVPVMPKIGKAGNVIAQTAPYAGALTASVMAYSYEDFGEARYGTALSGTMVPAKVIPQKEKWKHNGEEFSAEDKRLGLPVEAKPMNELCTAVSDQIGNQIDDLITKKLKVPFVGPIAGFLVKFLGGAFKKSYCVDDAEGMGADVMHAMHILFLTVGPDHDLDPYKFPKGFWTDEKENPGPKYVVEYAENGNDWMQVWGGVYGGNRTERAQKKVSVNGFNWDKQDLTQNGFAMYVSQSEIYFDCEEKWDETNCNKDNNAMYRLNWRARMRRVNTVNWATDLFGYYSGTTFGDGFGDMVKNAVTDSAVFKKAVDKIKGQFGAWGERYGDSLAEKAVGDGWKKLKSAGDGKVKGMLSFDTLIPTIIH